MSSSLQVPECSSPIPTLTSDVFTSPQHQLGGVWREGGEGEGRGSPGLLYASPTHGMAEECRLVPPNSPLLSAMREAVDSLNQYDDFEVLEKIGAGFFAEVFKVQHIPTGQIMVLKLNKKMTGLKKLKEVELLKKLSHPNILRYFGACVHNGQLHPLTEFMNGGALEQLIQNLAHPLPMRLRLKLSLDIAQGMDYLHCNNMLHRDLNSKNCLLRKKEDRYTAVVADFGLAAQAPSRIRPLHRSQSIVGNPFWMAPEVLNGKSYDGKADVFSYGIILCELISRLEADPDELPRTKDFGLDEVALQQLPTVVELSPPEGFMKLTFQCCQLLPVKRPDFSQMKSRLEGLLSGYQSSLPPEQEEAQDSSTQEQQPPKRLRSHINHHNLLLHTLPSKETTI